LHVLLLVLGHHANDAERQLTSTQFWWSGYPARGCGLVFALGENPYPCNAKHQPRPSDGWTHSRGCLLLRRRRLIHAPWAKGEALNHSVSSPWPMAQNAHLTSPHPGLRPGWRHTSAGGSTSRSTHRPCKQAMSLSNRPVIWEPGGQPSTAARVWSSSGLCLLLGTLGTHLVWLRDIEGGGKV
jgi:hypothetical protein